jgi:hypothetical protein
MLHPPWPLQAFWPLQAWLSVLHPPWPLQAFWPLQACLPDAVAVAADDGETPEEGADSFLSQPEAPAKRPATAATNMGLFQFIVLALRAGSSRRCPLPGQR